MQKRMPKTLVTSCFIILSLFLVYNLELFQREKNGKVLICIFEIYLFTTYEHNAMPFYVFDFQMD